MVTVSLLCIVLFWLKNRMGTTSSTCTIITDGRDINNNNNENENENDNALLTPFTPTDPQSTTVDTCSERMQLSQSSSSQLEEDIIIARRFKM